MDVWEATEAAEDEQQKEIISLHELPIELVEHIFVDVIVMEVKGMKLSKRVWKEKADPVISRLQTVCMKWSSILTTNYFRHELHRILDNTACETIRLEILNQSPIRFGIHSITTLTDEVFLPYKSGRQDRANVIRVCDRNNLAEVKDIVSIPGISTYMYNIVACNVSNCLYGIAIRPEERDSSSVVRITRNEKQFNISPWITDERLAVKMLSVSAIGSLIILSYLKRHYDTVVVRIYYANGFLQNEIMLPAGENDDFSGVVDSIQKSNGNLVLVSEVLQQKLVEIDMSGTIVRRYESARGTPIQPDDDFSVCFADSYGRFVICDTHSGIELLDSEFNLLEFICPQMDENWFYSLYYLHYNSKRNEVICMCTGLPNALTTFRFIEE